MLAETNGYPVPYHPTWEIIDSSKLQDYITCPRLFFYKYVLGWDKDELNNHLIFGEAWHAAMEHLLLHGYTEDSIIGAYQAFIDIYRPNFPEGTDELLFPKVPSRALEALILYCMEWEQRDRAQEVLYTEISGTVAVMENVPLHFRMDSILRVDGKIRSREHKTGSRLDRTWETQWSLKTQVGTYTHVLYCLYPPDEIYGIEINGAIFTKKNTRFPRIPIRKQREAMQVWWWNTKEWASRMLHDYERLHESKREDGILMAFPMATESCTKYFGCPFMDYCSAWPNPLQYAEEPPIGYAVRWWDPSDRPSKVVMNLDGDI